MGVVAEVQAPGLFNPEHEQLHKSQDTVCTVAQTNVRAIPDQFEIIMLHTSHPPQQLQEHDLYAIEGPGDPACSSAGNLHQAENLLLS